MSCSGCGCVIAEAVHCLSLQRSGFNPRPVNVGFVVERVELGQVCVQELNFSTVTVI